MAIAIVLPCGDFLDECLLVGYAAVEALRRKNAEFGLGQIEPAAVFGSVVPLETLDEPPRLCGRKGFIQRRLFVGIEIVLNQNNLLGTREVDIGQILKGMGEIDGGTA